MEPYTKHYGPLEEICDLVAAGLVLGALLSGGVIMNYISHRDNSNQKIEQSYEMVNYQNPPNSQPSKSP